MNVLDEELLWKLNISFMPKASGRTTGVSVTFHKVWDAYRKPPHPLAVILAPPKLNYCWLESAKP